MLNYQRVKWEIHLDRGTMDGAFFFTINRAHFWYHGWRVVQVPGHEQDAAFLWVDVSVKADGFGRGFSR